jgi:hypothetical protein
VIQAPARAGGDDAPCVVEVVGGLRTYQQGTPADKESSTDPAPP